MLNRGFFFQYYSIDKSSYHCCRLQVLAELEQGELAANKLGRPEQPERRAGSEKKLDKYLLYSEERFVSVMRSCLV